MTILFPLVGLAIGFIAVYLANITVPTDWAYYFAVAALAGLDTVIGGIRAGIEDKFKADVFISGFLVNTLLAVLLVYLGEQIGVELYIAAVVAIGSRIFLNLSLIRRYWLTQVALGKKES